MKIIVVRTFCSQIIGFLSRQTRLLTKRLNVERKPSLCTISYRRAVKTILFFLFSYSFRCVISVDLCYYVINFYYKSSIVLNADFCKEPSDAQNLCRSFKKKKEENNWVPRTSMLTQKS